MRFNKLSLLGKISVGFAAGLMLTACSSTTSSLPPPVDNSSVGTGGHAAKFPHFLGREQYPDFVDLIPAPPAEGTPLFKNDVKVYKETRKYRGSERWEEAAVTASLAPEIMTAFFNPVMSKEISKDSTPWTYYVISRCIGDAIDGGTRPLKNHYKRTRPFVYFKERTCSTKEDDDKHVNSGSFPSGHTAYGQLLAFILAEIDPTHQTDIIRKGLEYGDNRVICGFHWQSDVDTSRKIAGFVNARLHADKDFMEALTKAKAEFAAPAK